MRLTFKPVTGWLFAGDGTYRKILRILFTAIFLKFVYFNFFWSLYTTFFSFKTIEMWLFTFLATLLLVTPYIFTRSVKVGIVIMVLLDLWLVSNFLYFRTYNTIIPLNSYGLMGNLNDFKASVVDSFRWEDIGFFLITLFAARKAYRQQKRPVDGDTSVKHSYIVRLRFLILPVTVFLILFSVLRVQGGFQKAYSSRLATNQFASVVPMYTIGGSLCYEMFKSNEEYTSDIGMEIELWLSEHKSQNPYSNGVVCDNVIMIIAESFESWVIGLRFEGKEVTPNINRLLRGESVFYAPHIQSQAKGGRSIDGQLLVNTGLLPVENGAYSSQYIESEYPSLVKAFKEKHPDTEASVYTVDGPMVWNQIMVAEAFGYDKLYDKSFFVPTERVGPKRKTGDVPFFSQCADMMAEETEGGKHYFRQLVTYSGHAPFKLQEELAMISFETEMPERMKNYMIMANYTDHAIGLFVEKLKEAGIYDNTAIVITGDHEGLAGRRDEIANSKAGAGVVSTEQFVPLIVLNSPVSARYEPVMGQVDIYPTLLDLFGLSDYGWKGLGMSVFDDLKVPLAVTPQGRVVGDSEKASDIQTDHLKRAWEISDKIIRFNYFGRAAR